MASLAHQLMLHRRDRLGKLALEVLAMNGDFLRQRGLRPETGSCPEQHDRRL